jgi:hypothetical protein
MKRSIIAVLSVAMMASASNAWAVALTYAIVDYPIHQTDINTGLTDHVSGTITADPTQPIGSQLLSATLTVQASNGTNYVGTNVSFMTNARVTITDTQILITEPTVPVPTADDGSGGFLGLTGNFGGSTNNYVSVQWMSEVRAGGGAYAMGYLGNASVGHGATYASWGDPALSYTYTTPTAGGGLMSAYPVVIAEVPEPSTLVLLGIGAVSLAAFAWRRRAA